MEPSAPMAGEERMGTGAAGLAPYDWFAKNVQCTSCGARPLAAAWPGAAVAPVPASRPVRARLPRYSGQGEASRPETTGGGRRRAALPPPVSFSACCFACAARGE